MKRIETTHPNNRPTKASESRPVSTACRMPSPGRVLRCPPVWTVRQTRRNLRQSGGGPPRDCRQAASCRWLIPTQDRQREYLRTSAGRSTTPERRSGPYPCNSLNGAPWPRGGETTYQGAIRTLKTEYTSQRGDDNPRERGCSTLQTLAIRTPSVEGQLCRAHECSSSHEIRKENSC